jgi:hypothetical protein
MTRKRVPDTPPNEALPHGEPNPFLSRFKASLSRRWSLTRMETLYEISDLAMFLWALERRQEAFEVAASVAIGIPAAPALPEGGFNYNLWCPATLSHALVIHLASRDQFEQIEASRAALLTDPGIARNNPSYLRDRIEQARHWADTPIVYKAAKFTCQTLSRHLGSLVLYSELAKAGDPMFDEFSITAAALIPRIHLKLQGLLEP